MLRRVGIALAGICVAALTAAACVLSFEDLRALAVTGEADPGLAYLYPAAFDALLVIAMTASLLLWNGRWPARLQAGLVLALLLAAAAAAEVTTAVRAPVDVRQAAVGVAVAPWVMVLLALWLWFLLIKHGADRRTASGSRTAGRDGHGGYAQGTGDEAGRRDHDDIVPFPDAASGSVAGASSPGAASDPIAVGHPATASTPSPGAGTPSPGATPYAAPIDATDGTADGTADGVPAGDGRPRAARPVERAPHTPPGEPVHHAPVETPLDPQAAPPLESAPHHDLPPAVPLVGPTPAPETPEVDELPPVGDPVPDAVPERPAAPEASTGRSSVEEPTAIPGPSADPEPSPAAEPPAEPPVVREPSEAPPAPEPPAAPTPGRPVRWGDLLRPPKGDVLVHPLRPAAPEAGAAGQEADERGADTQPMLAIPDKDKNGDEGVDEKRDPAGRSGAAGSVPDPDPAHSAETADPDEGSADGGAATAPPPSGRMRSTPTPPDE
ncbi:DUF2637 domain-containing protein [Streptosporangium sandarakinum]|uniref:DUF2637 domain-containing protein n=1 Tax=Streptosporangium sandarakinum TaxID=1260955 RepID=UPI0034442887